MEVLKTEIELTGLHGFYFLLMVVVVISMVLRKDTAVICTIAIFLLGLVATGSFLLSVSAIFESFLYTLNQLLGLILVIAMIVAMTEVLQKSGVNEVLVTPFTKLIKRPGSGFWIIGLTIFVFSFFFWPSPTVALIGAFLLPVAIRAGIPPLVVAISMNLFGHGFALSGDYVIQGTPKLTADAANVPISEVMQASIPLVMVMGFVTTILSFLFLRRGMKLGEITMETGRTESLPTSDCEQDHAMPQKPIKKPLRITLAIMVAVLFFTIIIAMVFVHVQGDQASAFITGTSLLTLILIHFAYDPKQALKQTTHYIIEGFQFAFRIFTPVIPIASFFYLGGPLFLKIYEQVLPQNSHGILFDLGAALSKVVLLTPEIGVLLITGIGLISGLDGSGYAGISLIGQLSHLFVSQSYHVATLSAWGQVVSIWTGGGTLVPWALLPAAAICGVDPMEVARRNFWPVLMGCIISLLVTILLLRIS